MAFGTGTHPTTAMCLTLMLDGKGNQQIVDFGCGSGILGIAALNGLAAHAIGIDIDRQALIATKKMRNAMASPMRLMSTCRRTTETAKRILY